nr:zinc finger, CCHC-type [Tanacetum cinerariifolium]
MQLRPHHFGRELREKLVSNLMKDVEGTCNGRDGFVVKITGIEDIGKGVIRDGTGFVTFPVKYSCVVFLPFKGEILEATVIWLISNAIQSDIDCLKSIKFTLQDPQDLLSSWDFNNNTEEPNDKTEADNKKDKTAIAFLYQALPKDQLLQISKHKTAKAIWNALKTRHLGEERVQQARLQTLKSNFEMLQMKEDETIDAFATKLTTLVNKASSLGHTMEDETLVRKLLNAVPDRYLQIVASIEQYSDLSEMNLEEAISKLKTYEERIKYKGKQVDNQDRLLFTRYEE